MRFAAEEERRLCISVPSIFNFDMSSSEIKSLLDQIDAVKSDNAKLEAELGGPNHVFLSFI